MKTYWRIVIRKNMGQ